MWALSNIKWKTVDKQKVDELDFSRKAQKCQVSSNRSLLVGFSALDFPRHCVRVASMPALRPGSAVKFGRS
jgi:hypothetical protein